MHGQDLIPTLNKTASACPQELIRAVGNQCEHDLIYLRCGREDLVEA